MARKEDGGHGTELQALRVCRAEGALGGWFTGKVKYWKQLWIINRQLTILNDAASSGGADLWNLVLAKALYTQCSTELSKDRATEDVLAESLLFSLRVLKNVHIKTWSLALVIELSTGLGTTNVDITHYPTDGHFSWRWFSIHNSPSVFSFVLPFWVCVPMSPTDSPVRAYGNPTSSNGDRGREGVGCTLLGWHWLTEHTSLGSPLVFTLLFSNSQGEVGESPLQLAFLPSCMKRDAEYIGEEQGRWLVRLHLAEMLSLHYQPLVEPYRTLAEINHPIT